MMIVAKMLFILCAIVLVLIVVSVVTNHAVQEMVDMGFGIVGHRLGVKV
jgi:hypothetical protein